MNLIDIKSICLKNHSFNEKSKGGYGYVSED